MTASKIFVRVIGDYGPLGDMAFAEVTDRLHGQLRDAGAADYELNLSCVPAFDTYATGFMLAQLAINSTLGASHYFYVNTAPRKDNKSARVNNEGEGLVYARLQNGVQIVAVNSGYSLTLIKPFAVEIRKLNVDAAGSQFRSRDNFPQALGAILKGDSAIMGDDVAHTVPDAFPENRVVYTDGYGNLKCSISPAAIEKDQGQRVHIHLENSSEQIPVLIGAGIFDVVDGEFCFARGSSGWTLPNGDKVQFSEIIKRGGSASEAFHRPKGGDKVEWRQVTR